MKRIEKEIKKKSTELIESSLPEISSLDNIQPSPKKVKRLPYFLIPCGAALAVSLIMIPLLLKQVAPIKPTTSGTSVQPSNPTNSNNNGNNNSNNNSNNNNSNNNNNNNGNNDYKPAFDSFNEVAYYSYIAFHQSGTQNSNQLQPRRMMTMKNEGENEATPPTREDFVDEYGRYHYPIPYDMEYTFKDFLYFEFDTVNNPFLEQRIGNGHIYGLSVSTNIFDDEIMIVLKNGDYFYSCLRNGSGSHSIDGPMFIEYSSHKTIEGFDLIKDTTNKRHITLNFAPNSGNDIDFETLSTINIEGDVYTIDPESILYDAEQISCGMDELKERLGDIEIIDDYGGLDALVYDSDTPEVNTFTLDEFEGTFSVLEDKLYLGEKEILTLNNVNKIYVSEINKDAHRDLVFESLEKSVRMFNIYDVNNKKYLYRKPVAEIGDYDYYLAMRDDRLVINLFKQGFTEDRYILDYGYFAYTGEYETTIAWQNLYELTALSLKGIYETDTENPASIVEGYYHFDINVSYIVEIELSKYNGFTNPDYPDLVYQIECTPALNWNFLSMEDGVYRYEIMFQEKGHSEYKFSFYTYSLNFNAAVDDPTEIE